MTEPIYLGCEYSVSAHGRKIFIYLLTYLLAYLLRRVIAVFVVLHCFPYPWNDVINVTDEKIFLIFIYSRLVSSQYKNIYIYIYIYTCMCVCDVQI